MPRPGRSTAIYLADTKVGDKEYKKGQLVPAFPALKDDGTTSCLNWLYCGGYTEEDGNKAKRRDPTQTPMQAAIGLYPNWAWAWPVNRRILYNRASVDPSGKPWNPAKAVIAWEDGKWVGDVPDGPWPPMATDKGKYPFIMHTHGFSQLYGPGREDGPFSGALRARGNAGDRNPFSKQLSSPATSSVSSDMDKLAKPADPNYPIVLTTYNMTEHWCGGGETRNVPNLLEAEPQLYVEMSPELAKEKGIKNGDGVIVESPRGKVEASPWSRCACDRSRSREDRTPDRHALCLRVGHAGLRRFDQRLTASVGDPNTTIPEYKALCVNVRKADKLTEIA
jgi:formate dehydrogenase major subunit